jgi:MYXO-CTERM domain-containing protein
VDTLRDADGMEIDCSPFQCRVDRCLETCESVDDCVSGTVCDSSGRCVARSSAAGGADDEGGCGCRQGPAPDSRGKAGLLLALIGILAARRRSRGAHFLSRVS